MKLISIAIALMFSAGLAGASLAADYKPNATVKSSKKSAYKYKRAPKVAGYRLRGGYRNGDEFTPYIYRSEYGNYPRFDNRSFSEKVFEGFR